MKKNLYILTFLIALFSCSNNKDSLAVFDNEQTRTSCDKVENLDVLSYNIYEENDTIAYIKIGTDTTTAKPIILFLQGSLPVPLIFDFGDFKHINIPFDYAEISKNYHLIEISMPKTPLIADENNLDNQYCFVTDKAVENSFRTDYLQNNYLEKYVERANIVIKDLLCKKWGSKSVIHLIGHSQGAKVAAVVAAENKNISTVSLLGFNAFGRFDENIRRERNNLRLNKITGEEYLHNIEEHYKKWKQVIQNPDDFENGNLNWTSFSINYVPFLLKINVPIFVGFGTHDMGAENCDLLPIIFIENKKSNLTIKPYIELEHNFFELKDGKPNYKSGGHWTEVINDILKWTNNDI